MSGGSGLSVAKLELASNEPGRTVVAAQIDGWLVIAHEIEPSGDGLVSDIIEDQAAMSQPVFYGHWDIDDVSRALDIPPAEARAFFIDGRRGGFLLEGKVCRQIGGTPAPSQRSPYDVTDPEGRRWEVRALTENGIRFTPSNQTGSGREYNESAFLDKLAGISGFYIANLTLFPDVPFYLVSSDQVRAWHRAGKLSNGHMLYSQARALFAG